jgi:pentose-5-phosphate-3-epimerase
MLTPTVYPGILTRSLAELNSRIELFNGQVDGIHIDVADGHYVENITLSLNQYSKLPGGFFEAHLMVVHPEQYFEKCAELGFSRVLAHVDAFEDSELKVVLEMQERVHSLGMGFGAVFKRGVAVPSNPLICKLDYAMVMTINLGYSGQPFQEDQLAEIAKLRAQCADLPIAADGHVDVTTARAIMNAGVTHLVSTSYLTAVDALSKYSLLKGL